MTAPFNASLTANRGKIAIHIARVYANLGIRPIAVFTEDDAASLHVRKADVALPLAGRDVATYLNMNRLVMLALEQGCEAIHPGHSFLVENGKLARRCQRTGIYFVGLQAEVLDLFGDKAAARALAERPEVSLVAEINHAANIEEAEASLEELGDGTTAMLKALAGGGGRGMCVVEEVAQLTGTYRRCHAETRATLGQDELYVEQRVAWARHIEVQVFSDGNGTVNHLWECDYSLQQCRQELLEITSSPDLPEAVREVLIDCALCMADTVRYRGIGTFELLVDEERPGCFYFMGANPYVQVEHIVTEEVTRIDLLHTQLHLTAGMELTALGLERPPAIGDYAVQLQINLETLAADGSARPVVGTIDVYEPLSGPGLRMDGYDYTDYRVSPSYDSLLAKLVVRGADYPTVPRRAYRALCELCLEGAAGNPNLLCNLLLHPTVQANRVDTRFAESHLETLLAPILTNHPWFRAECSFTEGAAPARVEMPLDSLPLPVPSSGALVTLEVAEGERVRAGQRVATLEAVKMEPEAKAPSDGIVRRLAASLGEPPKEGVALLFLEPTEDDGEQAPTEQALGPARIHADLTEVLEHQAALGDGRRSQALARRRKTGQRTTWEDVLDLLGEGSFSKYGGSTLATQRRRCSAEKLLGLSPTGDLVASTGTVGAVSFGVRAARRLILAYDYTISAGTQGVMNHKKTDRLLGLTEQWRLPLMLFVEGGGGRPSDTDLVGVAGPDCHTFVGMTRLSGPVLPVEAVSDYYFAGNAALLGRYNVVIATRDATVGMTGLAMTEGGDPGRLATEEVGLTDVQRPNGVIDVLVADETEVVAVARHYLDYFQGPLPDWNCTGRRELRYLVPENCLRVYDIHQAIEVLADRGSMLELRRQFTPDLVTVPLCIKGRAFGLITNSPDHFGSAIDAVAGDKAAHFMQLRNAFDIPTVSPCNTPDFMIGPETEEQATVRHVSWIFVSAASLTVPFLAVVLCEGYGLGAQVMAAGSFHLPLSIVAWSSGEFGTMSLKGTIRLGFAKELATEEDSQRRKAPFRGTVDKTYRNSRALNIASYPEVDAMIDPAETRAWLLCGLAVVGEPTLRAGRKRPFMDIWQMASP